MLERRSFDIRNYKKQIRLVCKQIRREMSAETKAEKDAKILEQVLALPAYKTAKTLLCYVSMEIEVDTIRLIEQAYRDGKSVAVPYCYPDTRKMAFFRIPSLEVLKPRTMNVLEPEPSDETLVTDYADTLCILPGLCFDKHGYRLGYGGGYYDRFLSSGYTGVTAGICYSDCVRDRLRHGRYDVPCAFLLTDTGTQQIPKDKRKRQNRANAGGEWRKRKKQTPPERGR